MNSNRLTGRGGVALHLKKGATRNTPQQALGLQPLRNAHATPMQHPPYAQKVLPAKRSLVTPLVVPAAMQLVTLPTKGRTMHNSMHDHYSTLTAVAGALGVAPAHLRGVRDADGRFPPRRAEGWRVEDVALLLAVRRLEKILADPDTDPADLPALREVAADAGERLQSLRSTPGLPGGVHTQPREHQ